jgi:hypothetical protein
MEVGKPGELPLPSGVYWRRWARSPNGVILVGIRPASNEFVQTTADGSGQPSSIVPLPRGVYRESGFGWSDLAADGSRALFNVLRSAVPPVSRPTLLSVPVSGGAAEPITLLESPDPVVSARFSPDGRWAVYNVGLNPSPLFVRTSSGLGSPRQIAADGASPVWRGDGKEIVYFLGENVMSISVQQAGRELRFGDPRVLFSGIRRAPGLIRASTPLAISDDGSRLFWLEGPDQPEANLIHIKTAAVQ